MANFRNDGLMTTSSLISDIDDISELMKCNTEGWFIGVKLGMGKTENGYEISIYTPQYGVERRELTLSTNVESLKRAEIIKFQRSGEKVEASPIAFYISNRLCAPVTIKYNKSIKLKLYAVLGFRQNNNDDFIFWTDVLGVIRVPISEVANFIPKDGLGTLSLNLLTLESSTFQFKHGVMPKLRLTSIAPVKETKNNADDKTLNVPLRLWPVRCIRVDDLQLTEKVADHYVFTSLSKQEYKIRVAQNFSKLFAPNDSSNSGPMTSLVYPKFDQNGFVSYYEPLVIGPKKAVVEITSEKLYNWSPKTIDPSMSLIQQKIASTKEAMDREASKMRARKGFTWSD